MASKISYEEYKKEVMHVFRHVSGMASRLLDPFDEGMMFVGALSSILFEPLWAKEFHLSDIVNENNRGRALIICDDYKQKVYMVRDLLNTNYDGIEGYLEMPYNMWKNFRKCVEGIAHKYFYAGGWIDDDCDLDYISDEQRDYFIENVYKFECDRMLNTFEEMRSSHGHIIISVAHEVYTDYMYDRFVDAGYKVEKSNDKLNLWVILNDELEMMYEPKDGITNHNFGHNDA